MANKQVPPEIKNRIEKRLSLTNTYFTSIAGGERSDAFSFSGKDRYLILRVSDDPQGFKKDKYVFSRFSKFLPVPETVLTGKTEKSYFSVTKQILGVALSQGEQLSKNVLSDVCQSLNLMAEIKVDQSNFYGPFDSKGIASFPSWTAWVLSDETAVTRNDGYHYSWASVKASKPEDKKIINEAFEKIKKILLFVPSERYLVHGDFGIGNLLFAHDHLIGIIDWSEAMYGDFLYDAAYFDFWFPQSDFLSGFKKFSEASGLNLSHFDERILCHKLTIGLRVMAIYALIHFDEGYQSARKKVEALLEK